jgi:hypothetical protein
MAKYLGARKTKLSVSRRFNLSAPNTSAIAFYSETEIAPCKMFWAIRGLSDEEAKIFALWLNSTINIGQILANRAETEGAFMGLDQYILQKFLVPDPEKLYYQGKKKLIEIFEEQGKHNFRQLLIN